MMGYGLWDIGFLNGFSGFRIEGLGFWGRLDGLLKG